MLNSFNNILITKKTEELPDDMTLYWAVCLIETNQPEKAEPLLKQIEGSDDSEFQEDAQWLQALIYLKSGDKPMAKESLEILTKESSAYSQKAKELLKKIGRKKWL